MNTHLQNGIEYEIYTKNIISNKYLNCYLWKEVPNQILIDLGFNENSDDIGCDIVCQNHDFSFVFIQCKNYSTTGIDNTINISDLSGFYNFIAETGFNGIVYYSGRLSAQILYRKRKIQYINLPFIKINKIIDFIPKEYQIEAYNKLLNSNRSLLSMPCGTGKTFVSFMLSLNYTNVIILTPLISTTEQIHTHYKNYYSKYDDINYILINSKANRDINKIQLVDKNIICSTYDSCDIINKLLNNIDQRTLIIIDECHNLTQTNTEINKLLKTSHDILYISATPKENITFNNKYELKWENAIINKYITDYNFYYPNNDKIIESIDNLQFNRSLIEKTILINKAYFLLESIKLTQIKKCIVYLKSIIESNQFTKIIQTLNIYFNLNIKINEINYQTTVLNRKKYLNKFANDNTAINILANVHILDEGIDIPECDSVYLTNPNNNPINIIQRISRANRIDKNNNEKIAKIFIWSKNEIKLEQIINRLSHIIEVKYGTENNEFINKKKLIDEEVLINKQVLTNRKIFINEIFISLLKEHTNIDVEFINTFFKKFKIGGELNFDIIDKDAAKYLGVDLINIRKRLANAFSKTKKFFKNVDYIKIQTGKTSAITYMLNYQCFEKLAMSGDSAKSESVRMYFIKLREFLVENQHLIYQALDNKINLDKYRGYHSIYFFAIDERKANIFKVGRTKDIVQRLRNYNIGRIKEVELKYFALVKNPLLIERCIKLKLKSNQLFENKEIFKIEPKILKKVIYDCYCKYVSKQQNKDMYEDISNLLGLYSYTKDKINIKPYIIIDKT